MRSVKRPGGRGWRIQRGPGSCQRASVAGRPVCHEYFPKTVFAPVVSKSYRRVHSSPDRDATNAVEPLADRLASATVPRRGPHSSRLSSFGQPRIQQRDAPRVATQDVPGHDADRVPLDAAAVGEPAIRIERRGLHRLRVLPQPDARPGPEVRAPATRPVIGGQVAVGHVVGVQLALRPSARRMEASPEIAVTCPARHAGSASSCQASPGRRGRAWPAGRRRRRPGPRRRSRR